jgi:hypothetical protein
LSSRHYRETRTGSNGGRKEEVGAMGGQSPLRGRVGYWLRQVSDTHEKNIDLIVKNMRDNGGGDCLCLKVADGTRFQGRLDPSGLTPIYSINDIVALSVKLKQYDVTLLPVAIPRGEHVAGEAYFHGEIAKSVGSLMTHIVPYEGFFTGGELRTVGTNYEHISEYSYWLRQSTGPDVYLINQPDPNEMGLRDAQVGETSEYYDGIAAQHYVGWVKGPVRWTDVDLEVQRFNMLTALGKDMYVTLYGMGRSDLAVQFLERVRPYVLGWNILALGRMDIMNLRMFRDLGRPIFDIFKPRPEPPSPPSPVPPPGVDYKGWLREELLGIRQIGESDAGLAQRAEGRSMTKKDLIEEIRVRSQMRVQHAVDQLLKTEGD